MFHSEVAGGPCHTDVGSVCTFPVLPITHTLEFLLGSSLLSFWFKASVVIYVILHWKDVRTSFLELSLFRSLGMASGTDLHLLECTLVWRESSVRRCAPLFFSLLLSFTMICQKAAVCLDHASDL